ncbi:HLH domain-containing protein, partial [Cephalotus follicularis]
PQSELARQRRQKISEKTRCLQKLLPWDKKMDTATMLGEAYEYVRFLQAQVTALHSMPCQSSFGTTTAYGFQNDGRFVSGLGSLNRQQLLQVMLNSPVAQTMLYSRGLCVFSMEQLM